MSDSDYITFFSRYIEAELGIIYSEHNLYQLEHRLELIAQTLGFKSIRDLFMEVQNGIPMAVRQLLLDTATNNETSFFRDINLFHAIEAVVCPFLFSLAQKDPPVSIWSAACSSGQEALSIGMLLLEWSEKKGVDFNFKITGTDISETILAKARAAEYTQLEIQRGLTSRLVSKYFIENEYNLWVASAILKEHIDYQKVNLIEQFNFVEKYSLILCRNVLIYLSVKNKQSILKKIHSALKPNGYLILGSGESLIGLSDDFAQVFIENVILYKKIIVIPGSKSSTGFGI